MKKCHYCGRENPDEAGTCQDCGRPLLVETAAPEKDQPAAPWKRLAVLGGEVEAERLELALKRLEIPHVLVSYRDSALDGLYQNARGWGHIEGPEDKREAILSCLEDLRRATLEDDHPEPNQP